MWGTDGSNRGVLPEKHRTEAKKRGLHIPTRVSTASSFKQVTAGFQSAAAIGRLGHLAAWGWCGSDFVVWQSLHGVACSCATEDCFRSWHGVNASKAGTHFQESADLIRRPTQLKNQQTQQHSHATPIGSGVLLPFANSAASRLGAMTSWCMLYPSGHIHVTRLHAILFTDI
jgi:hypothetical protein